MLVSFILVTIISFIFCLSFTPLVRILALRLNLVDVPDNRRKVHERPIPRVGGVAVAAAYFGSLVALVAWLHFDNTASITGLTAVKSTVPAALLIFLIGLTDDIFNLNPRHKFGAQIVAAVMAVLAGVHMPGIHIYGTALSGMDSVLTMALSVLWLVLCTNAVNLIDGLDGLAGGVSFLATITILVASLATGNMGLVLATAPLAAVLLGFLVFNFNPASIFLGDSGSLLIGFLLGCYSILWSGTATTALKLAAPLLALAVPILDVTLAISRRFLRNQPIFKADRSHIHHRLLARGFGHKKTVLLLYAAAGMAGTLSLCLIWAQDFWAPIVLVVFAAAAISGIQQLGYTEFDALRRVILRGGLRSEVTAQLAVQTLEAGLNAAGTVDDAWTVIQGGCEELGLHASYMQLAGNSFHSTPGNGSHHSWDIRIPISSDDWIELSQSSVTARYPNALVPFVTIVRRVLADKSMRWVNRNEKTADYAPALYTQVVSAGD
jgi:UDP-GlcNAc:undecaprenyl-phosphate/decaprenyl-phosphate GlcNAc-1-phosphate transferase